MRKVSCPSWGRCFSLRQETIRKRFPARHGTAVFHTGRKLFAKGFLFGMGQRHFISIGNYLRRVSYSAWDRSVSQGQETICEKFPIRHGTEAYHSGRKLYAKGFLLGMRQRCFITIGNFFFKKKIFFRRVLGNRRYAMIISSFLLFLPIYDKLIHSLDKRGDGGYTN